MRTKRESLADYIFIPLLVCGFFAISPFFDEYLTGLWGYLVTRCVFSLALVYIAWFKNSSPRLILRIPALILGTLYIWVSLFIPSGRGMCLLNICLTVIAFGFSVYSFITESNTATKNKGLPWNGALGIELLLFLLTMARYASLTEDFSNATQWKFICIALVPAAIAVSISVLLCRRNLPAPNKKKQKGNPRRDRLLLVFFVTLVLSLCIFSLALDNLNFAWDRSEPSAYTCEILDKKISYVGTRRRGRRREYKFQVILDGESRWMEAYSWEYDAYDIGDTITYYLYDGFFHEPYFASENLR